MGDASTLNAKSGHPGHQLLIVLVGQHPAIKGLEKSKNHRHKLGETLISLGRHRAILRGFCGLVTRDLQDDGPVRPQVDRHPARLRSRWRTIQGSRGGRIALGVTASVVDLHWLSRAAVTPLQPSTLAETGRRSTMCVDCARDHRIE
jgi:hypothetical protein